jgi:hypothetical protein
MSAAAAGYLPPGPTTPSTRGAVCGDPPYVRADNARVAWGQRARRGHLAQRVHAFLKERSRVRRSRIA